MYCKTRELILFFCQIESKGFHCDCLCQRRLLISVKPKSLVTMMTESSVRAGTAPPERTICQRAPVNPSILLILEVSGTSYRSDENTQEHIVLERSAKLNLDPKIWRPRWNVLKEKMMFVRGIWLIRMIICKRLVPPDNHLQEGGPSRWSFARGRSLWMIICRRSIPPDDHLQEAGPSG